MTSPAFGDQTASDRTLSLVKGYHRDTYPPAVAYSAGLFSRFAVVLDTYRHGNPESFFDVELFLAIASAIFHTIPHEIIRVEVHGGGKFDSLAEFAANYRDLNQSDREAPYRIYLSQDDRVVCIMWTEFWICVGGPKIYHDSYTFSFYTANDRSGELRAICEEVSARLGATVTEFHEGVAHKEPFRPWWKKMLRVVGLAT